MLSPLFIIVLVVLAVANRGKPFFFQERPGKDCKIFRIIKFKTMSDKRDQQGKLLPDHLRYTSIGTLIRKTSLDEIPQLINVLRGEMSIVGPRPLLPHYLPLYNSFQKKRHGVKPGITGLAQVSGRNALSWEEKFRYDIAYVESVSFSKDLSIIVRTVKRVISRKGVNADSLITMQPFTGN